MEIDLWTDVVCPWCYIGVTRFERALAKFNGDVTVRLHPFQLDPEAPIPGVPATNRYRERFGDEAESIVQRVTDEAAREGLTFRLDRALAANTFDAHRALRFAGRFGKASELEHALYRAYFTDGLDISDRSVLADLAAETGVDRDAISAYLASDDDVEEVTRELNDAFERGITAVPTFVFNDEFMVPGAVDSDTFLRILNQMYAMRAEQP
jgi:predicted DsbA family dithiol-disulfide isomerase